MVAQRLVSENTNLKKTDRFNHLPYYQGLTSQYTKSVNFGSKLVQEILLKREIDFRLYDFFEQPNKTLILN